MESKFQKVHPFRVLCIDNDDKPLQIDQDEWVEEREEYIVTEVFKEHITKELCYKLMDMNPDPYDGFLSSRFVIINSHSAN
jgi:hypothetical protein